ncbi:MAG TPA: hypothetical protein VLA45_05390 [Paracoccaceae bacterium]|nr:hypothetical protein [Paracoccaceae bacterium]
MGLLGASSAKAQLGGLGDLVRGAAEDVGVGRFLQGEAPISTALADAQWGNAALDGTTQGFAATPLASLPRTDNGGFRLSPGYYTFTAQSYCLHAGTHGPGGGDGYLYAPLKGSQDVAVRDILRNSVAHPGIAQSDVQQLIWAILARAKFEDLNSNLKLVAAQLLSRNQLARLNRSALDLVPSGMMSRLIGDVPGPLRTAFRAESALREGLTVGGASYAELESIAVLTGAVGIGEGSRAVPSGRWSDHPDGYRIRYIPSGYSETEINIWVEQGGPVYDPSVHVAVPGNTSRQRLAQSGRAR